MPLGRDSFRWRRLGLGSEFRPWGVTHSGNLRKRGNMKLVIASDIHGSAKWCREVMRVIEETAPDKVLLLGDLLYHGPRNPLPDEYAPADVAAMLNSIKERIIAVRGNCEAEVDQMMLEFPCMADYAWVVDGPYQLFCTHGHLFSPESLPPLSDGATFVYGHFHVKKNEIVDGVRLFNPGSAAIPKDDSHSVGLYEDGAFSFRVL